MTLPASGSLSFSQIRGELQRYSPDSMRDMSAVASKTAPDSVSEFHGYTYSALKNNLLGCWEMTETSGTILYDRTAAGNNMTLGGTYTLNQTGIPSKSVLLNNGYAQTASNIVTSFPLSYAFWFKYSSLNAYMWSNRTTNYYGLYQGHNTSNWAVTFGSGGGAGSQYRYTMTSTVNPPQYGVWYHAVAVSTAHATITFYVNGVSKTLTYLSGTGSSTSFGAGVYNIGYSGSYMYVGQTAAWSRSLTASEVSSLYNGGNGLAYSSW